MSIKKWVKIAGVLLVGLVLMISIALVVVLGLDSKKTSYLRIQKTVDSYVIKNVNIVPMTNDTILINYDILVRNGSIFKIAPDIFIKNAQQIDGRGKFLSPGLADMHVHVWDDYELGLYLSKGVTTLRNMWGMPFHLRMKERLNRNEIYAPLFLTASPKLTGPQDEGIDKKQLKNSKEARRLVAKYKKQGYDYIKTYSGLPPHIFDAIKNEALAQNISLAAHPSFEVPYGYHFSDPIRAIEHTEDIVQQALKFQDDSLLLDTTIEKYVQTEIGHTPTLTVFHKILEIIEKESALLTEYNTGYINPAFLEIGSQEDYNRWTSTKLYDSLIGQRILKQHQQHLRIVKRMIDAGVLLMAGTDSGISYAVPGYGIHEELGFYKEAGLSNYEVLKTATLNPSKVYKELSRTGTIEVGKLANMVLTRENPLVDLRSLEKPEAVFIKGQLLDIDQLTKFEEKAFNRNNYLATIIRLAEGLLLQ
ncbi:amidohydrolase [Arenibacter aquaticus]|uniref:Amidohydrolase n=1 Tax=Arenibacter aquaticus TaxID=2489054 RepID=A0A3S0CNX3_9FLAO|nr:amidohydrolase family protein [Arenibacter aquaticus]RTE53846.1 amidohydrolase [Arenibacter aquaticus]